MDRRRCRNWVLTGCLAGLAACGAGPAVQRPAAVVDGSDVRSGEPVRIAEDAYWLRGEFVAGRQPDGNSVLLLGRNGWIVVDSGRHAAHTQRLIDFAQRSGRPVAAIVNTHWHLDHVSGNGRLRDIYPQAKVYAAPQIESAMRGFLAEYRKQLQALLAQRSDDPQATAWREELARIDQGARLYPTDPVATEGDYALAGTPVHLGTATQAVSGGDLWVLRVADGLLIAGDLVTLPVPLLDTACPTGWRETLARLDKLDFDRLVPGHGAVMTHAQFRRYRRAYDALLACAAGDSPKTACAEAWLRDMGDLIPAEEQTFARSLLVDYYIDARLRMSAERRSEACGIPKDA